MRICYDPHEGVNFTAGSLMYAFGKGHDLACKGMIVDDQGDGLCQAGHVRLDLPLDSERRDRCGTKRLMADVRIIVKSNLVYILAHDLFGLVGVVNYDVSRASQTISPSYHPACNCLPKIHF